ncbi:MAG: hypothetical protein QOC91_1189 [Solirubrobacteraceae bacterium]|nr:hypothetical protein [Solirubrobacteraceae bacterium]
MFTRAALLSATALLGALLGLTPASAVAAPVPGAFEAFAPSPAQLQFGAVDVHFGGNPQQSVQLANGTPAPVAVFSATITGADASSFQISGDGCSAQVVEAQQSCSVDVTFLAQRGPHSAALELLTGEGPITVALSAEGITGTLSASPDPLSFAPLPYTPPGSFEGQYNENESVNVSNSQAGTQIESISISGPDASSFSVQWSNCEHTLLGAGNSCGVSVGFAASSPGLKQASLVLDSDSGTPLVVALQAQALNGPRIAVDALQALLGDVPLGSSAQHTIAISNSGDYPLVIQQAFRISGTPLMFPILSDTCSRSMLNPGASCTLTVGFSPSTVGEKDASIVFITNTSPITVVGIDGVGVPPAQPLARTPDPTPPPAAQAGEPPAASQPIGPGAPSTSELPRAFAASPHSLAPERAPHLYGFTARAGFDTGFVARCPAPLQSCQAIGVLSARWPAGTSRVLAYARTSAPLLLGSTSTQLRGGQASRVRIPLYTRAVDLLRRRGQLHANLQTIVRAGGRVIAERTQVVTLSAPARWARAR